MLVPQREKILLAIALTKTFVFYIRTRGLVVRVSDY